MNCLEVIESRKHFENTHTRNFDELKKLWLHTQIANLRSLGATGDVPGVPGFRGRPPVLARNLLPLDEAHDDDHNGGVVAKIRAGRKITLVNNSTFDSSHIFLLISFYRVTHHVGQNLSLTLI